VKYYGIVNEEASERVEKLRIRKRVVSDYLEIALRKRRGGKERSRTVYFYFFGVAVLCLKKM
jgi:hypothetical protein